MELQEWLQDARTRMTESGPGRRLVDQALQLWKQGVIPSQKLMHDIRAQLPKQRLCARLEDDGSCKWLRKWGLQSGLAVPPIGERAMCPFVRVSRTGATKYEDCPGFKRG